MRNYRLHLIRHGLIEANFTGQYIGRMDVPLCRRGVEELVQKSRERKYPFAERLYVSPLKRCLQTGEILYPDMSPVVVDDLAECHFGVFEGMYAHELKEDEAFVRWLSDSVNNPPEGGEGAEEFGLRCLKAFEQVFRDMMANRVFHAVAITHASVISTLLSAIAFPRRELSHWRMESGEGYTILISPDMWMRSQTVELFDTVPSLEEGKVAEDRQDG